MWPQSKLTIIILSLLLLFITPALRSYAVAAAPSVSTGQWQQLTSDKAFGYKNDKESITPKETHNNGFWMKLIEGLYVFFASGLGFALIWIAVIGVGLYAVYRLFINKNSFLFGKKNRKMAEDATAQDEGEDIATTNWEAMLQQAVGKNDLRMAVRYSYMWLLQLLQQKEQIQYRNDKTNFEYYTELKNPAYKQPFKQLSRQYEYAWYGNFDLSAPAYNQYIDLFNNLRHQLGA